MDPPHLTHHIFKDQSLLGETQPRKNGEFLARAGWKGQSLWMHRRKTTIQKLRHNMEKFSFKTSTFQRTKWADAATDQLKHSYGSKSEKRDQWLPQAEWMNKYT